MCASFAAKELGDVESCLMAEGLPGAATFESFYAAAVGVGSEFFWRFRHCWVVGKFSFVYGGGLAVVI